MKPYHINNERFVTKIFKDVFDKYDIMNDLMSLGIHRVWKRKFINWLNPQKNTKLIDVASGTGDIAKLFLKKVEFESFAYCVDENQGMLNISKNKNYKSSSMKWFCNDGEKLPFNDNYFDYYTISFGIRNFNNINKALDEAYRVLKPGGRFLCLEFSKVQNDFLNQFYKIYSKSLPTIGKIIVGKSEPYEYLVNSIEKFYNQEDFLKIIEKRKFKKVTFKNLNGGIAAIHSAWKD
jgi:demethylmenaquinone methyltransferase / 2-methoxy-6-polyprenyl-1,4-benzoquinol methylase